MRILHTADWHIGAKTDDLDRFEEQKDILQQIIKCASDYKVDMVLIAGDIYHNIVPSSEDEELFYNTVVELSRNGDCAVVAIAGNHDDPKRLSNASVFSDKFGVHLIGHTNKIKIDKSRKDTNIYATRCGKGFIEFHTQAGEDCVIALLPFPSYYRYEDIRSDEVSFQEKVKLWLNDGGKEFRDDTININLAHAMSYGVDIPADEFLNYTNLSTTFNFVDQKLFHNGAHYTALGHIHRTTAVNKEKNIYYSGGIMHQFFDNSDTEKNVLIVDLDKDGVKNIVKHQLDCKELKKFEVNSVSEAHKVLDKHKDILCKIVLQNVDTSDQEIDNSEYTPYVTPTDIKNLRKQHPNLVTLAVLTNQLMKKHDVISKKNLTNSEIFEHFVMSKLGRPADEDVKELFLSLMSEGLYEAD